MLLERLYYKEDIRPPEERLYKILGEFRDYLEGAAIDDFYEARELADYRRSLGQRLVGQVAA
ncbi:uncharacterized protein SEPMUDRAFT_118287 [Sphaerulina musiva SO2202]|uniref:Uncharacterized protein n=1 Tax=Sphaerulina musiva (strain SO2202) TaxID=692275 RepID=N1QIW0_SPHMS|nr:uncharacterized protein SEPMUDRAFT_118287 [Sphaerulina musiva SO2202]EMF12359.1 hypothetical protein SEPMUDRAFT_118287 [Sphaerulina musiva SO2202]